MATATIARQEEDLEEVAEMNGGDKGKGNELKENREKCKIECHHQKNGQNGGQKLNGNENGMKGKKVAKCN